VVVQNSTRHQLESEPFAVDYQGVASVVASLVADYEVHLFGDKVGKFPLAFVAPLGANDNGRRHGPLLI